MLFGYPIEAIQDNWFHECLLGMLDTIHNNVSSGLGPFVWPDIIPDQHQDKLKGRWGLRDRLKTYENAVKNLTPNELKVVAEAIIHQNDIEHLLSCQCDCEDIDSLPNPIRQIIKDLFEYSFENILGSHDLKIRDNHYRIIFEKSPYNLCPFCGCETFESPEGKREDLDHYLAESKYPFAAVNLQNLVPMGHRCNSKYKLAQDILYKDDGITRRKSYYPYSNGLRIRISLDRSRPFSGNQGIFAPVEWQVDFEPDTEEAETWDEVFHIRERYIRDLNHDFRGWLGEFVSWCKSAYVRATTTQDVLDALGRYASHMETIGIKDRTFLRAAVFRMLDSECKKGNQRVIDILSALVFGVGYLLGN